MSIITHITNLAYSYANFTDLYKSKHSAYYTIIMNKIKGAKYDEVIFNMFNYHNLHDSMIANSFNNCNMTSILQQIFKINIQYNLIDSEIHKIKNGGYYISAPNTDYNSDKCMILLYILHVPFNSTIVINDVAIQLHKHSLLLIDSSCTYYINHVINDKLKYFKTKLITALSNKCLFSSMFEENTTQLIDVLDIQTQHSESILPSIDVLDIQNQQTESTLHSIDVLDIKNQQLIIGNENKILDDADCIKNQILNDLFNNV